MSDILETQIDNSVINFTTLNGVNIYGIYDPDITTLSELLESFYNNYKCKEIKNKDINIISDELQKSVYDLDSNTLMKDLNLSKITKFRLIHDMNRNTYNYKNIYAYSKIKPSNPKPRFIQVFCKTLTGKTITMDTVSNATIEDLKLIIKKKEGIPVDQLKLSFCGLDLENYKHLYEYGIQEESIIHIILRLRGGMYHETSGKNGNFGYLQTIYFVIKSNDLDKIKN
jgi:hypothetical protein